VINLVTKLVKPVSLAALTTFTGFISFTFAPLPPIFDFGLFAGLGVLASLIVALAPVLLTSLKPKFIFGTKEAAL